MINRITELKKLISSKEALCLEIGPYFTPIVPKNEGYNVVTVDVFSEEILKERCLEDPNLTDDLCSGIETVDYVTGNIRDLLDDQDHHSFDNIISSHNLEHLPNPIDWLKTCALLLKPGGFVSMAIPDHRCCWDFFRPYTITADWVEAYFEQRDKPTPKQVFVQSSMHCRMHENGVFHTSFTLDAKSENLIPLHSIKEAFGGYEASINKKDRGYEDTHCWALFPSIFSLILLDLNYLELLDLSILEVSETHGNEFFVHLQKTGDRLSDEEYYKRRDQLLRKIGQER